MADSSQYNLSLVITANNKAVEELNKIGASVDKVKWWVLNLSESTKKTLKTVWATATAIAGSVALLWKSFIDSALENEPLQRSFERLSQSAGIASEEMLNAMRKASRWTVADTKLMASANTALSLWVVKSADDMATLMEIARVKWQAMWRSMEEALDDIVRWLGRASPMILDNLWIVINQTEAQEEYAKTLTAYNLYKESGFVEGKDFAMFHKGQFKNEEVKKLCQKYQDLKNIRDGNVEDAESELKELAPIIDEAFENFSYFVCNGLSAAVEAQVEDEAYMQMLAQIDYNKTNAEKARSELQNMISAKKDRVEDNTYKDYAVSRMMVTIELYPKVEIDEYTDVANPIISEHVAWLYSEYLSGSDEDGSKIEDGEVSSLEERKEILEEAKEEALENNQNKEADDIDKLLDDLNSKLDDASGGENDGTSGALSKAELDKELKEKLVSEAEKNSTNKRGFANCFLILGDTDGAIEMLGDEYGEDHDSGYVNVQSYFNGEDDLEGNLDNLAKELDNINGLNNDIKNKTKEAIKKVKSNSGIDEVGELQGALKNLKESTDGLSNEDKMKINGNVDKIEMELSDLLNSYNDKFVKPDEEKEGLDDAALENLLSEYTGTAEGRIIVTVVLDRLIQKGYSSYSNLCIKYLRYCFNEENPYLQNTQYDKDGTEYAQLYTISAASGFRYIFSDDDTKVVLSNYPSSEKYMFELGDNQVRQENKKYSNLKKKIIFSHNDMYISEKDCKKNFNFVVEPVITCKYSDSYFSALFNDDMEKEAQEIEKQILGTE